MNFRGNSIRMLADSLGKRINSLEYSKTGRIGRLTNMGFSMGMRFQGGSQSQGNQGETAGEEVMPASLTPGNDNNQLDTFQEDYYGQYVDFKIPWSLTMNYDFNYTKNIGPSNIIQTVRLNGDLSLTPKMENRFFYRIRPEKFTSDYLKYEYLQGSSLLGNETYGHSVWKVQEF